MVGVWWGGVRRLRLQAPEFAQVWQREVGKEGSPNGEREGMEK